MMNLIRQLRRREVFRSVGLYVGGVWIVLQVAELILPVYNAPEWVMKALISIGIIGFPIAIILAWSFDFSADGIRRETKDAAETRPVVPAGRSKMDYVVVGVLVLALAGSLFGNFAPREPLTLDNIDPVSVLIADFDNSTGEAVFDGTLEQTLLIAIEESPFITAFDRTSAGQILAEVYAESKLDASGARLVSAREGIGIVVNGGLDTDEGKYTVSVFAIDVESGDELANLAESADGKLEVMNVIGELALELRQKLGDVNTDVATEGEETFTTVSIEAMHDYVNAQRLARDGLDDQAIGLYQSAVDNDANFGRAWTGLAVSADKLGQTEVADMAWKKAMSLLASMTERERYRTSGVYYTVVARNSQKAIENYQALVDKYPSDDAGYNNLAVAYFFALQFDKALEAGQKVVDIYPRRPMYHANYSLYAMYASDFASATTAAEETLQLNPNYHKAYLPFAAAALVDKNVEGARDAYEKMAATGPRGRALADIGIADLMLWNGEAKSAEAFLVASMQNEAIVNNNRALAMLRLIQAEAKLQQSADRNLTTDLLNDIVTTSSNTATSVPAAMMYAELGQEQLAVAIAAELAGKLNEQQRAYSKLIEAVLQQRGGDNISAINLLQEGIALADLWLLRLQLGKAYFAAGHFAEAESEFTLCHNRLGEAYSIFLNDTPSFRYTRDLDSWLDRAREKLTAQ